MKNDLEQNLENNRAQMRKGTLEFCILLAIAQGKKMYASDILKELKKIDLIVVEGTLYPLLNRLKREGILDYVWEESKNGPPRKYYIVTKQGKELISQLTSTWNSLSKSITSLLHCYE